MEHTFPTEEQQRAFDADMERRTMLAKGEMETKVVNCEVTKYTVTAEVQFSVQSTSITQAYRVFTKWMADAFNASFAESEHPIIAPAYYKGVSVKEEK
jgi:hypothetical protein